MACKDCLHFGICKRGFPWADGKGGGWCEDFKDKSCIVELPCKIGDIVYRVCKKQYDVDGYGMQWVEDWGIIANTFHLGMFHEIGRNVFLTREEAEAALAERTKSDNNE